MRENGRTKSSMTKLYQVFMVEGVNGRYSLTFPEGQAVCEERGTIVASREDLLEARGMGYDMCVCGWLSDGTGGFVVQTHDPGCTFEFHTGVIDWCGGMMDVYCKV
ncbi:Hyaluronan and proteoglycan link protein 3 [Mactra antiquata]